MGKLFSKLFGKRSLSEKTQSGHSSGGLGLKKLTRAKAILCATFAVVTVISVVCFGVVNMPPKNTKADTETPDMAWYNDTLAENSSATEFEIKTVADLYGLAALVKGTVGARANDFAGKTIKLTSNIDLGGEANPFTPIGYAGYNSRYLFKGTFDGGGHTISGLYINKPNENNVGLFCSVEDGTIKNLGVYGTVIGGNNVGGIVGKLKNGTITNCYGACNVAAKNGNTIAGVAGGLVGLVSTEEDRPLIGVKDSFNLGTVSGYWSVGGIAGKIEANTDSANSYANAPIKNCFNLGTIIKRTNFKGDNDISKCQTGGIVGRIQQSGKGTINEIVTECYYLDGCGAEGNGTKLTLDAFKNQTDFSGFDFTNVWEMGLFMPQLKAFGAVGSESNPYLIANKETLTSFAALVNGTDGAPANDFVGKTIKLTSNIDLGGNETNKWTPIGIYTGTEANTPFKGTFDGGGFEVSGLYIDSLSGISAGLFGYVNGGTIKNLGVYGKINITITDGKYSKSIGGLVGYASASTTTDATITNCYNSCEITLSGDNGENKVVVGGVVGETSSVNVTDCYNVGNVTLSGFEFFAGGIIGQALETNVSQCYNIGSLKNDEDYFRTDSYFGGIVGHLAINSVNTDRIYVENCYNVSTFMGANVAGIVGYCPSSAEVEGRVFIKNCYSCSKVELREIPRPPYGVIATKIYGIVPKTDATATNATVENCYYLNIHTYNTYFNPEDEISAEEKQEYYKNNVASSQAGASINGNDFYSEGTFSDFDFTNVWEIDSNLKRPVLKNNREIGVKDNIAEASFDGGINYTAYSIQREYKIIYHVGLGEITSESGTTYATSYVAGVGGTFGTEEGNLKLPGAQMYAYTFGGWYTDPNFSGEPITSIAKDEKGDIHLYAKFTATEYGLGFESNQDDDFDSNVYNENKSSSLTADTKFTVDSDAITITLPVYAGYHVNSIYYNDGFPGMASAAKNIEFECSSSLWNVVGSTIKIGVNYTKCSYDKTKKDGVCTTCKIEHDHVSGGDNGGSVATCLNKAVCGVCEKTYGELADHDFATEWTKNETSHYHACKTSGCTEKDSEADHSGGTATCQAKAVCAACASEYGKLDKDNHVKGLLWVCGNTFHLKQYECCGAITVANEAHAWNGGVCGECGFKCSHRGGTATCNTRAKCTNCGSAYGLFDANAHNLVLVDRVEATASSLGNVEHYRCSRCAKTFEDALGKVQLNITQIVIDKVAPQIIEGAGQTHTKGNKQLVFRSNAAFSDFIRVTIDGFTLPLNHYEVKEGSIIVILNEECLSRLSEGEHVLEIVSVSGAAKTTFVVAEGANGSGSATVWVWVGVAAAAVLAAAVVAFIVIKKRKA